jgi:hypothetical protein
MALRYTKSLTGMSSTNIPGDKGRPADLTVICAQVVQNIWERRRFATKWARTVCYGERFTEI